MQKKELRIKLYIITPKEIWIWMSVLIMSYEHKLKTENIYSEILSLFKINVYYKVIMNYTGLIDNINNIFMLTCSYCCVFLMWIHTVVSYKQLSQKR